MYVGKLLYSKVVKNFPISCVDILIKNTKNELLFVKRKNQPAKGCWWIPGGRVIHGEKRKTAAKRKAREECGIAIQNLKELGTFELFL